MDTPPGTRNPQSGRTPIYRSRSRWITVIIAAFATIIASLSLGVSACAAGPTEYTIFGNATPTTQSSGDSKSVEVGVRFSTSSSGWIKAIRFYQGPGNTGQHSGSLWSSTGAQLARVSFSSTTSTGWQEARLSSPVAVTSGATYTASYTAPNGHYAADADSLSGSKPKTTNALTATQGVYVYGSGFPKSSYRSMNYYVDVVFSPTAPTGSDTPSTSPSAPSTSPTTSAPTPTSTTTTPPPTSTSKPGPNNTGVPDGTNLTTYTGPMVITTAGTVIDSKDIKGSIRIRAKNVVIKNSKIHDDPSAISGVYVEDSGSLSISDSEIYNFPMAITYSNWTANRVDMHDISFDAMKVGSNVQLRNSWVHAPKPSSDAHWDGGQVQAGITNTVIDGNNIDATGSDTNSALFLVPDLDSSSNGPLTVNGNWLNGGNYTIYVLKGRNGYTISNITVTNNKFGHGAKYGPAYVNVPVNWSGNVWEDSGKTINY